MRDDLYVAAYLFLNARGSEAHNLRHQTQGKKDVRHYTVSTHAHTHTHTHTQGGRGEREREREQGNKRKTRNSNTLAAPSRDPPPPF